jgi:putative oxidoreductase
VTRSMASASVWPAMLSSDAPRETLLIRLLVGWVFVSEGLQKFIYPDALGAGRFAKIGIPAPQLLAPFVGAVEIACGALIVAGLLTRLAAIVLIIDMFVAIASTKVPILIGHGYLGFAGPGGAKTGFWSALHEARVDLSMLIGASFLLLVGAGEWSLDARLQHTPKPARTPSAGRT